jgi:acetyltransferase-like isoleucine patch superfamily enzyme
MIRYQVLQRLWIWRWMRVLVAATRSVRVHPAALLLGPDRRFVFGTKVKIGARSVLDIGALGSLVVGDGVWISTDVEMQTSTRIVIDRGTTIQRRCTINGTSRIGAGCIFAPNVFVSSGTHAFRVFPALPIREQERRIALSHGARYESLDRAVWIQADCWLGTNVVVSPGVTIGKGSVIGANSVVTRDVPPYSIFAGCPAKSIGVRLDWSPPATVDAAEEEHEIYVLDGARTKDDDGSYGFIADSNSAGFIAALSNGGGKSKIRIFYRARAIATVSVEGHEFSLREGSGVLEIAATRSNGQGYVQVELKLLSPTSVSALVINKVSVVSES